MKKTVYVFFQAILVRVSILCLKIFVVVVDSVNLFVKLFFCFTWDYFILCYIF